MERNNKCQPSRSHRVAAISSATRRPDETAPSIKPTHSPAVSEPAQWMRPTGRRNAGPAAVHAPGVACRPTPTAATASASSRQRRCLSFHRWRARRPRRRAYAPGSMRRAGLASVRRPMGRARGRQTGCSHRRGSDRDGWSACSPVAAREVHLVERLPRGDGPRSGWAAKRRAGAPTVGQRVDVAYAARTSKCVSVTGPKDVISATSTASRPRPPTTRPTRRRLLRASKVCHAPSR